MTAASDPLRGRTVICADTVTGTIAETQLVDQRPYLRVTFHHGQPVLLPHDLLVAQNDGTYTIPVRSTDLTPFAVTAASEDAAIVVPVIAEALSVEKRTVVRGRVQIHKRVETHEEYVNEALVQETVDVERVPVNRVVQTPPNVRFEGETMIIALLEEVLVVEKRLVVREELRVTRRKTLVHAPQTVTLRREYVDVERLAAATPSTERQHASTTSHDNRVHAAADEP